MFFRILIFVFLIGLACKPTKHLRLRYIVQEVDKTNACLDSFFRIKIKPINSNNLYSILSTKNRLIVDNIEVGDVIKLKLVQMNKLEWREKKTIGQKESRHYCGEELLLDIGESFYKTDDIVGLELKNPKHLKKRAKK